MFDKKTYFNPMHFTSSDFTFLSIINLRTLSTMLIVKNGINTCIVDIIRSYKPYSAVDRALVYKGTSKRIKNFEEKLLIARIPVFFIRYFNLISNVSCLRFFKVFCPYLTFHLMLDKYFLLNKLLQNFRVFYIFSLLFQIFLLCLHSLLTLRY